MFCCRYSAEFTVYRELIQNANDAGANEIQIEFKTMNLNSQNMVESIVVKNNGRAFTQDDWRRLKKIAEGNPDEQKVRENCSKMITKLLIFI